MTVFFFPRGYRIARFYQLRLHSKSLDSKYIHLEIYILTDESGMTNL
jgi:hypothetical protein